MRGLFHDFLYVPIYNLLVFFVDVIPGGDIGLAVVCATVVVKLVLMPLSLRAARTQRQMTLIKPHLKELQDKHKDDSVKRAEAMLALYREHKIRPFASIFGILIQLPIIFALYFVFSREALLNIDPSLLYSFVPVPEAVSPLFLGVFTVSGASIALALIAGLAQFAHARVSIPAPDAPSKDAKRSASEDFARMMSMQARYVLPIIIVVIAYVTSGAVALYFITSSLVGLLQEAVVRATHRQATPA